MFLFLLINLVNRFTDVKKKVKILYCIMKYTCSWSQSQVKGIQPLCVVWHMCKYWMDKFCERCRNIFNLKNLCNPFINFFFGSQSKQFYSLKIMKCTRAAKKEKERNIKKKNRGWEKPRERERDGKKVNDVHKLRPSHVLVYTCMIFMLCCMQICEKPTTQLIFFLFQGHVTFSFVMCTNYRINFLPISFSVICNM